MSSLFIEIRCRTSTGFPNWFGLYLVLRFEFFFLFFSYYFIYIFFILKIQRKKKKLELHFFFFFSFVTNVKHLCIKSYTTLFFPLSLFNIKFPDFFRSCYDRDKKICRCYTLHLTSIEKRILLFQGRRFHLIIYSTLFYFI